MTPRKTALLHKFRFPTTPPTSTVCASPNTSTAYATLLGRYASSSAASRMAKSSTTCTTLPVARHRPRLQRLHHCTRHRQLCWQQPPRLPPRQLPTQPRVLSLLLTSSRTTRRLLKLGEYLARVPQSSSERLMVLPARAGLSLAQTNVGLY